MHNIITKRKFIKINLAHYSNLHNQMNGQLLKDCLLYNIFLNTKQDNGKQYKNKLLYLK